MRASPLVSGTIVLVATAVINRGLGFLYRILTLRLVGAESVGLYETVFPTYLLFLVAATSGVPVALTKVLATALARQDLARARRAFRFSFLFLITSGLGFAFLQVASTPSLTVYFFPDPRARDCFLAMALALPVVALASAFRSYFQGRQEMVPPALAQVAEQVVRVGCRLFFALRLAPWGAALAALGLALGMVLGEVAGLLFLLFYFFFAPRFSSLGAAQKGNAPSPAGEIFRLALPVTFNRVTATLALSAEAVLIPRRLQAAGIPLPEATRLYGEYAGAALTLLHLPTVVSLSLATVLIPAVSEAQARGNRALFLSRARAALRLTLLTGLPCALAFYFLGTPLAALFFGTPGAGPLLKTLAWGAIFLYLQQTASGVLQGLGEMRRNFRYSLLGALVNLGGIYFFVALPALGIQGAALALNLGTLTTAFLTFQFLFRRYGLYLEPARELFFPLLAAGAGGLALKLAFDLFSSLFPLFFALAVATLLAAALYFFLLLLGGSLGRQELAFIPSLRHLFR